MSYNWKNILVAPIATIQEVLKVIDSESLQLALVVDDENRLLGTVTDGDVRRALINNLPFSLRTDEQHKTLRDFVNMLAEQFDLLRSYIDNYQNFYKMGYKNHEILIL